MNTDSDCTNSVPGLPNGRRACPPTPSRPPANDWHCRAGSDGRRDKKMRFGKLLTVAAVILFLLLFGKSLIHPGWKSGGDGAQLDSEQVITDDVPAESTAGIMGGPVAGLEQLLFDSAKGAVDFSADDAEENADVVFFQENSVVAVNSPLPNADFSGFRKDILEYVVKSGDTPEDIANAFNVNTYTLLWANNLRDGDIIRPGDKLIILPINGVRVKISSNDTISSLAKKYSGKGDEIITFNSLPENGSLRAGDYIIIPGGEMPVSAKAVPAKPKYSAPKYASSVQPANNWLIWPTAGRSWGRIHSNNGVDVANHCGTPIYAAAAGQVILSDDTGWNGGYGKYIEIRHPNGVVTFYAHASQLLVSAGESVAQGQLIAYMGTTGRSTGCHLHFEVRGAKNPLAGAPRTIK